MAPPDSAEVRQSRLLGFLVVAGVGLVALLAGLVWDLALHARNIGLAHQELVFSLANPAHVLFLLGVAAVVVGVSGAAITALGQAPRRHLRPAVKAAVATAAVTAVAASAAVVRFTPRPHESPVAPGDSHGDGAAAHASHSPGCNPTPAQQAAADRLLVDTKASLKRFVEVTAATGHGYRPVTPSSWVTVHYLNAAYAKDGRILDPAHPEALVYANTTRGPVLAAAMYLMGNQGEPGPEIGGCLTKWHTHEDLCFSPQSVQVTSFVGADGRCDEGTVSYVPPDMMHVWVVDVPGGPFAHKVDGAALSGPLRR